MAGGRMCRLLVPLRGRWFVRQFERCDLGVVIWVYREAVYSATRANCLILASDGT